MKTQDEINRAATQYGYQYHTVSTKEKMRFIDGFTAGANFANGYSVEEMCGFAEWVELNAFKCNPKQYQLRGYDYTVYYIQDLLKLYNERNSPPSNQ